MQDSSTLTRQKTLKFIVLNFFFDLFDFLLDFLKVFTIYRLTKNFFIKICFIRIVYFIFYNCFGRVFLNFRDAKYRSQYCWSVQTFNNQNFKTQPRGLSFYKFNPLSGNLTKWSNTLKQFVSCYTG